MFNRLIEFLISIVELFFFMRVIDCYEEGVLLRLGDFKRKLNGGRPHFVWPFAIDKVLTANVVLETKELPAQAFTTRDGISCVASAVATIRVKDVERYLLHVQDADAVLADASRGPIRQILADKEWMELQTKGMEVDEEITKACRRPAFQWGIEVLKVTLSDLTKAQTYRVLLDGNISQVMSMIDDEED